MHINRREGDTYSICNYCFIQNNQKHRRGKENTKENKPPKFRVNSLKEQEKQGQ